MITTFIHSQVFSFQLRHNKSLRTHPQTADETHSTSNVSILCKNDQDYRDFDRCLSLCLMILDRSRFIINFKNIRGQETCQIFQNVAFYAIRKVLNQSLSNFRSDSIQCLWWAKTYQILSQYTRIMVIFFSLFRIKHLQSLMIILIT